MKRIRLRGQGHHIGADVRAFLCWLETVLDIRHVITVIVDPKLQGYFDGPGRAYGYEPYMVVEAGPDVLETIAHEFVHYEQWRDRRDVNERGVDQRARALVKRFKREAA